MDAAAIIDRDLRVVYCNAAYIHLTGWRPREFERSKMPGMCHHHFGLRSCQDGCVGLRAMETNRAVRVDEVQAARLALSLHVIAIPLTDADGVVFGALEQYRDVTAESHMQERYRGMLEQEREQRRLLAQELATTTATSRAALEQERRLSQTDGLTGLYNRRHFDGCLAENVRKAVTGEQTVALIVLDLDHFKRVNDTFGHEAGDETIREFASIIRSSARDQDVACRIGGEEFAIIVIGNSAQGAPRVAERVQEKVRESVAMGRLRTTTSGGIAMFPVDGSSPDELREAADKALYGAKRAGRGRILPATDALGSSEEMDVLTTAGLENLVDRVAE